MSAQAGVGVEHRKICKSTFDHSIDKKCKREISEFYNPNIMDQPYCVKPMKKDSCAKPKKKDLTLFPPCKITITIAKKMQLHTLSKALLVILWYCLKREKGRTHRVNHYRNQALSLL